MYNGTCACFLTLEKNTNYFERLAGVPQGDKLAPFQFAIDLDYIMMKAINGKEKKLSFKLD